MASTTLHLVVDKGPKQGETLARNPGTLIRIGRVIKGNTFAIKDPAISQKHLAIEFSSEISRWTVKDLDTSNGTIINDAKIPSSTPFPLSDGDTIKIGETTLISVKIEGDGEIKGGLRRGRKRGARARAETLDSVVEAEDCEDVKKNVEDRVEEPKNLGRGRTRKGNSSRILKKDEILGAIVEDSVEMRPRRAGVRTRAASARILKEERPSGLTADTENLMESNVEANSMRISKKNEILDSVVEAIIEEPKNVKRGKARKAPARTRASSAKVLPADELLESDSLAEEVGEKGENNAGDEGKEMGSGEEEKGKRVEEETVVDFEKMTLGEWFDSMEKYLPRAINEVAEQMIANLREKARRFDEHVLNLSHDEHVLNLSHDG